MVAARKRWRFVRYKYDTLTRFEPRNKSYKFYRGIQTPCIILVKTYEINKIFKNVFPVTTLLSTLKSISFIQLKLGGLSVDYLDM